MTIPAGLGSGDLPVSATAGGVQTQPGVVISVQKVPRNSGAVPGGTETFKLYITPFEKCCAGNIMMF
jgi:hypothetical protein